MARNPAEEDTKFQVNSYVSMPGKDFSNQKMIRMGFFRACIAERESEKIMKCFLVEPSMSSNAKRSARSSAE